MNEINRRLFIKAMNRLRRQWFGDEPMKFFEMTPETGETEIATLDEDWCGRRAESTTSSVEDAGFWQFHILATDDWKTSQAFLNGAVSFKIGDERWKVTKRQKPSGRVRVWKLKAEKQ